MSATDEKPLDALLQRWLVLTDQRQQYLFLTNHPELLCQPVEQALQSLIARASASPQKQNDLCLSRALLTDARQRGSTPEAIRDACVNIYGGFALDVPEWLAAISVQDEALRQQGRAEQVTSKRTTLWEEARQRAKEESRAPVMLAEIDFQLGDALRVRMGTGRPQHLEAAIAVLQRCEQLYTRERYPLQWARIQHQLGILYKERIQGEQAENLEQAIACHEATLFLRTREACPHDWAATQNSLGITYHVRIRGNYAENQERAIALLEVCAPGPHARGVSLRVG